MDLQKIGTFLKDLRKEKGLTQEQLAETLNVSRRTVSRWETGSNMPDLDLLMEIADLYEVDLREMLNGERKSEDKMQGFFLLGILALAVNVGMEFLDAPDTFWTGVVKGITIGIAVGSMILGILYTTGAMMKVQAFKKRLLGKETEEA